MSAVIRRATPADCETLLDCWLRSVKATHTFVSAADIESMIPHVRDYLSSSASEIWIVCNASGTAMGFMGMSGSKMEALFLAPEFHGQGIGRMLVQHARSLHSNLTVDVNEQNVAARRFYEACGFVVEGRSELDEQGRPYPLLHMRLPDAIPKLTHTIMPDGSRCFLSLRPGADWYAVRDHVSRLPGAELTEFLTDGVTEAWIDFRYQGHSFNINDAPGDYWFFVADPACADTILRAVASHFAQLLGPV